MYLGREYSFRLTSKKKILEKKVFHLPVQSSIQSLSSARPKLFQDIIPPPAKPKPISAPILAQDVGVIHDEPVVEVDNTEHSTTQNILQNTSESTVSVPDYAPLSDIKDNRIDTGKRSFLKMASMAGLGAVALSVIPKKAEAYVMGSTPASNVVGVKDAANTRVNPATEETLLTLVSGQGVIKKTVTLTGSGMLHTPGSGKKVRVYANRFSLSADMTNVSFRFTAGGSDFEKYISPKTGGLYGANNHPNFVEGGINEVVYCVINGTGSVQVNLDYLEV